MRAALVFLHHRNAIGVPRLGVKPAGLVERQTGVVRELRPGNSLDRVFVIQGCPLTGEVRLRGRGGAREGEAQENDQENAEASRV
jgi:hypothetical protein